jgi:hypothetical protein
MTDLPKDRDLTLTMFSEPMASAKKMLEDVRDSAGACAAIALADQTAKYTKYFINSKVEHKGDHDILSVSLPPEGEPWVKTALQPFQPHHQRSGISLDLPVCFDRLAQDLHVAAINDKHETQRILDGAQRNGGSCNALKLAQLSTVPHKLPDGSVSQLHNVELSVTPEGSAQRLTLYHRELIPAHAAHVDFWKLPFVEPAPDIPATTRRDEVASIVQPVCNQPEVK